ncbi:hypothetical protein [Brackiella oedipodis]|uniref:hypothetical protein n=1 Tax=Brackiella oedipodis TaxID=124225 RepID=UPI00048F68E0|nr:hypothetical protein [Brackiella oedipodis]
MCLNRLSQPILGRLIKLLPIAAVVSLGACSTYLDVPPNSPLSEVERIMGKPRYSCPLPDNKTKLIWNNQPMGQYGYAAVMDQQGLVDRVYSSLRDDNIRRLGSGVWSKQRVWCEFGPPQDIERVGLGEKNEVVWSYRYKQANVWNSKLYIFMGKDGEQVTHYYSGPDPAWDWLGD